MDEKLGESREAVDTSEDESPLTDQLRCPLQNCRTKTVKLRRHLHKHNLSDDLIKYAIDCSKIFAKNSQSSKSLNKSDAPPNVNRKGNYKVCPLCNRLFLNLTDHLQHIHKLQKNSTEYETFLKSSEVIPRCYTKIVSGVAIRLSGKQLEEAKARREEEIEVEREINEELQITKNLEKKEKAKEKPNKTSTNVTKWKKSFQEHLSLRGYSDPPRGATMAVDVLLSNEPTIDNEPTVEDLLSVLFIRDLMTEFKKKTNTNDTTKIKYLKFFKQFIEFLTTDVSSPEHKEEENEVLIAKDIKLKKINYEIENAVQFLSKNRGKDLIKTRERAQNKIIPEEDTLAIRKDLEDFIENFVTEPKENLLQYTDEQIRKVRDVLITSATLRLARRSRDNNHDYFRI